MKNTSIILL